MVGIFPTVVVGDVIDVVDESKGAHIAAIE